MLKIMGAMQLPVVLPFILGAYIVPLFVQWPEIPLPPLPPSPLEVTNVVPSIFAGSLTAISVIIGFFSVSMHSFLQRCEDWINTFTERDLRIKEERVKRITQLEQERDKLKNMVAESKSKETETEIGNLEEMIDKTKKEYQELEELIGLNIDAFAHLQEHSNNFMATYLFISYLVLMFHITSFYATLVTSAFIGFFILLSTLFLSIVFSGLVAFLSQTTLYHGHQELIEN